MDPQHAPSQPAKRLSSNTVWGLAVLMVVLAWGGAVALRGGGEKVVLAGWQDGMPAGQAMAQEMDRPMVVLFTAGWCRPCQGLKKSVLTKPEVMEALQAGFVPVQIDMTDLSLNNPNLAVAERYNIQGYPTVLAMDADGQEIGEFKGERSVEGFRDWLAQIDR